MSHWKKLHSEVAWVPFTDSCCLGTNPSCLSTHLLLSFLKARSSNLSQMMLLGIKCAVARPECVSKSFWTATLPSDSGPPFLGLFTPQAPWKITIWRPHPTPSTYANEKSVSWKPLILPSCISKGSSWSWHNSDSYFSLEMVTFEGLSNKKCKMLQVQGKRSSKAELLQIIECEKTFEEGRKSDHKKSKSV